MEQRVKLSQWDALMLEGLRALGWSDDEILNRLRAGNDLPTDDSAYQFDFKALADFAAANTAVIESAVRDGYTIKYNTLGGIRSWLNVVYKLEPVIARDPGEERVVAKLTEAQREGLAAVLSHGWAIRGGGAPGEYRVEPEERG